MFDEDQVVKVPTYLTPAEAATLPCAALTAWNAIIEKGKINADKTVLIQGTGGVALFAAQFSLMSGAQVILLSGSDEAITANQLHPIVHKIYPSSAIKQALLELEQGNHYGKICISLSPSQ